MKMRSRSFMLALVSSMLLLVGLAQGAAAQTTTVTTQLPQVKQPTSERFDMNGTVTVSGVQGTPDQAITITGSGATSNGDMQEDFTISMPPSTGQGQQAGPTSIGFSTIMTGGKLYYKISGIPNSPDTWYVVDLNQVAQGAQSSMPGIPGITGIPGLGNAQIGTGMLDPRYAAAFQVQQVGKETINGAATTKYQINVDIAKLLAAMNATGGSGTSTLPPDAAAALNGITMVMYMWVGDADSYMHQFRMTMSMQPAQGTTTSQASGGFSIDLTITFHDFDAPVTITAPANAQPIDLGTGTGASIPGLGGVMPGTQIVSGQIPGTVISPKPPTGMPKTGAGNGESTLPWSLLAVALCLLTAGMGARRWAGRSAA